MSDNGEHLFDPDPYLTGEERKPRAPNRTPILVLNDGTWWVLVGITGPDSRVHRISTPSPNLEGAYWTHCDKVGRVVPVDLGQPVRPCTSCATHPAAVPDSIIETRLW